MRIAINPTYGSPDVITIANKPKPRIQDDELLVQVFYSSVTRSDIGFLKAKPWVTRMFAGIIRPRYPSLGCEFSGVVDQIGKAVATFSVGDRVFGYDDAKFGGHAEYKKIKATSMVGIIPDNVSFANAAASTEGAHYALAFMNKAKCKKGDEVFVHGATGGIGSAMVQFLVARGIKVTASSPTEHLKTVERLGASEVVDWQKTPLESIDRKFNHFFDAVGKSSFATARKLLLPGGSYISSEVGSGGQNIWLSIANPVLKRVTKRNVLFPIPSTNKQLMKEIQQRLASNQFIPLVDRKYPLADIKEAYKYVDTGQKLGNVLIEIQSRP